MGGVLMARVKESTGIVGLDVVANAQEVLISLNTKMLDEIKVVPDNESCRKAVESFTNHRLSVCQEEEDWEQIEKQVQLSREGLGEDDRSTHNLQIQKEDIMMLGEGSNDPKDIISEVLKTHQAIQEYDHLF